MLKARTESTTGLKWDCIGVADGATNVREAQRRTNAQEHEECQEGEHGPELEYMWPSSMQTEDSLTGDPGLIIMLMKLLSRPVTAAPCRPQNMRSMKGMQAMSCDRAQSQG